MKKYKCVLIVRNIHTNEKNIVAYFITFGDAANCLEIFRENSKNNILEYSVIPKQLFKNENI